jgi:hypothetical protein
MNEYDVEYNRINDFRKAELKRCESDIICLAEIVNDYGTAGKFHKGYGYEIVYKFRKVVLTGILSSGAYDLRIKDFDRKVWLRATWQDKTVMSVYVNYNEPRQIKPDKDYTLINYILATGCNAEWWQDMNDLIVQYDLKDKADELEKSKLRLYGIKKLMGIA